MQRIKRNDTVRVLSGKDRGRQGVVRRVMPDADRLVVQGINMIKRHQKARSLQEAGGIIEREASIHTSNVMLICKSCNKAVRVTFRERDDGQKVRRCKKCGEDVD